MHLVGGMAGVVSCDINHNGDGGETEANSATIHLGQREGRGRRAVRLHDAGMWWKKQREGGEKERRWTGKAKP